MDNDSALWIPKIESAAGRPLRVLKDDTDKHTLKTTLEPWGQVCLHDMRWRGMKKNKLFFRKPPGRTTWESAAALNDLDIPVVKQLLYLEIKQKGFISHTYQVSRWLDGYNLGEMARERTRSSEGDLIAILMQASLIIARLHRAGFVHGDLKWSNLLHVPGWRWEVILTDLDHLRLSDSPAAMGRDLARFILSVVEFGMPETIEGQLIAAYLEHVDGLGVKVEKSLFRRLARKREEYKERWGIGPGHILRLGG